jgi:hypothetical protein
MIRNGLKEFYASQTTGVQNEFKEVSNAEVEMKAIKIPKNIPVTILASYQMPPPPLQPEDLEIKKELFNQWVNDAPQVKLVSTTQSGHYIHYSEPTLVIDAILEMIENVQDH